MRTTKRKALSSRTDDVVRPTPERRMQIGDRWDPVTETTARNVVKDTGAVRAWSSLENLYRNRVITGTMRDAGEKYYRDWFLGYHASESTTMRWSDYVQGGGATGGQPLDAAERRVFHVRRFQDVNRLLDQIGVRKPVHWLIINDLTVEQIGRQGRGYRGKDSASAAGATLIVLGLKAMARFYGLEK